MDRCYAFICYQHKAQRVVDYIVNAIEDAGINCWCTPRNLDIEEAGKERDEIIFNAISNASCFIAIISDDALKSTWCKCEIAFADEHEIPIIPFEIAPITIINGTSAKLAIKKRIVAYDNPSNSIELLIQAIKEILSSNNSELIDSCRGLSNEIGTKGAYSIMSNEKGEILLMLSAREGEPESPRFIYDGSGTALLYRNHDSSVAFRDIDEEARMPLKSVAEILVIEVLNDDKEREYMVPVRLVKNVEDLIT
ncbi:MAG: toll/interleukin-1 receptor domain-containing protein [Lentimicrobiaceae bacterium]|nr:toll/interleukin-1 receptor domain-containing protein [Lentimicrobiaceae bacterium]